jgi:hypothetical protein
LKIKGSSVTVKRSTVFSINVLVVSMGRADMTLV